ncbi:MAG: dephospho-CoA kinase [Asticcacaulis sp.]|nr:dephospho-CoA kinase [Asticcacaulis sp.]
MIRLGLTGSIGMGKSTVADMFEAEGVPVWDADEAVHRLYASSPDLQQRLMAAFGDVVVDGVVDRARLSQAVRAVPGGFDILNGIVHPATVDDRTDFMARHAGAPVIVADIPLLYETSAEKGLDKVVVVSAPADIQRTRVLARPGMTQDKFEAILARQLPDAEKRRRADFIIDTSRSLEACREDVRDIIQALTAG